jgi:hypothetical protein
MLSDPRPLFESSSLVDESSCLASKKYFYYQLVLHNICMQRAVLSAKIYPMFSLLYDFAQVLSHAETLIIQKAATVDCNLTSSPP